MGRSPRSRIASPPGDRRPIGPSRRRRGTPTAPLGCKARSTSGFSGPQQRTAGDSNRQAPQDASPSRESSPDQEHRTCRQMSVSVRQTRLVFVTSGTQRWLPRCTMSERGRYWRRWLGKWKRSGLTQAEFCRRHGLKAGNFGWWKRKLGEPAGPLPLVIAEIVSMAHKHPMFPLSWRGAVGLGDHVQRQKLREHPRGTACRTADRTDSPAINHVDATAPSSPSRNDTGGLFQGRRLGRHPAGLRSHPVSRQATTRGEGR